MPTRSKEYNRWIAHSLACWGLYKVRTSSSELEFNHRILCSKLKITRKIFPIRDIFYWDSTHDEAICIFHLCTRTDLSSSSVRCISSQEHETGITWLGVLLWLRAASGPMRILEASMPPQKADSHGGLGPCDAFSSHPMRLGTRTAAD